MLSLDKVKKIFDILYKDIDGHHISTKARKMLDNYDKSLTYGEVTPETFQIILNKVQPKSGEIFYDLGCGTGKAVILALLLADFKKIVGIEFLKELSDTANNVLLRLEKEIRVKPDEDLQDVKFINADFLNYDFSDANVIFTHSTCFSDQTMTDLERKLQTLKTGSRVIFVTKWLNSSQYKLLDRGEYPFTWGRGTVSIYEKIV